MRRNFVILATLLTLLLFTACGEASQPELILPANTVIPTATCVPTNTPLPTVTNIPTPSAPPSPSPFVPTVTSTPSPTPSPTPTPTPTPSGTPTPTSIPTPIPTVTMVPRETLVPTYTPTPTITPTPTSVSKPVASAGLPELTYKENTILKDTLLTSEEEANRQLFQKALDGYYQFGLLVEDLSMLHTEEEYLELFPEFIFIKMESLTKYHNGYYLRFSDLKTTQTDLAYRYALRTGDTSFLTETEQVAYQKLFTVAEELNLAELNDIDAVIAAHDYLVLNTAYDEKIAISEVNSSSHYAEGTLLKNTAVCSGYASTFQLLMELAGIQCEYVWNDSHAWNIVQLGDKWYHIDVTWDDPTPDQPGVVIYTHLLMTDDEVSRLKDHESWQCECGGPHNCDDESYRLYAYQDYICSTEAEAAALVQAQAENEIVTLVYPISGELTEDNLIQLVFSTLHLSGNLNYYPSEPLGSSHLLLRIMVK